MNRTIKFRVWDKKHNRFIEGGEVSYKLYPGEERIVVYVNEQYFDSGEHRQNDFELMQSTGLFDKNAVEIFEGDLLNFFGQHSPVVFADGAFWIEEVKTSSLAEVGGELLRDIADRCEVIGNIFENPELIN
jgi:uncharacterized phage protein (TIGR01671 family)